MCNPLTKLSHSIAESVAVNSLGPFGKLKREEQKPADAGAQVINVAMITAAHAILYERIIKPLNSSPVYLDDSDKASAFYDSITKELAAAGVHLTNYALAEFIAIMPAQVKFDLKELHDMGYYSSLGIFLSALINLGSEDRYTLDFVSNPLPINQMGYCNIKRIEIIARKFSDAGTRMQAGTLTLPFCPLKTGTELMGGSIIVDGLARHHNVEEIGRSSKGGEIHFLRVSASRVLSALEYQLREQNEIGATIFASGEQVWPLGGSSNE